MLAKDQQELSVYVEKGVAGLAVSKRYKAKKLLKRYACAFATNNKDKDERALWNMKLILAKRDR